MNARMRLAAMTAVLLLPLSAGAQATFSGYETRVTTNTGDQYDPAISGNLVVFTDYRAADTDVWYHDLATGVERPVSTAPGYQELTDVSGGLIVYTDYSTSDVFVFDTADGTSRNLSASSGSNSIDPAVSQGLVAWTDDRDGNSEIYARNLASGEERRVTTSPEADEKPAVGGKVIAWQRCSAAGSCDIWSYDWATGTTTQVTATADGDERHPDVSGSALVYQGMRGGEQDVYRYDLAARAEARLDLAGAQVNPNVSGDFVAFEDLSEGIYHIKLWHLPTGTVFQVTRGTSGQYLNDIDGNRVVYTDDRAGQLDIYLYTFTATFPPPPPPTEQCRSVALEAAKEYGPSRWDDDFRLLAPAMRFALPASIPVTAGSAGNRMASFSFGLGLSQTFCIYAGAGAEYRLHACSNGETAGTVVQADRAWLHVDGDRQAGTTRARLVLAEVEPCAGALPPSCDQLGNAVPLLDHTFVRATSKPYHLSLPFFASPGPGLVCIDNGVVGHAEISAGRVWLNGVPIVNPADWKPRLEIAAPLNALNLLSVQIASKPGAAARVRVFGTLADDAGQQALTRTSRPGAEAFLEEGAAPAAVGCSQSGTALAPTALLLLLCVALWPRAARAPRPSRSPRR